jgi:FkbM family methyltransferase
MLLPERLDAWLKSAINRMGYSIYRNTSPQNYIGRRIKLLSTYGIDLVLDVGANSGQYARQLRSFGYANEIISFEPMKEPYEALARSCASDQLWTCRHYGLGENTDTKTIHISGNSVSSSILPMMEEHERHAPRSHVIGEEIIEVRRLDEIEESIAWGKTKTAWLKIDVQGFEDRVLAGASGCLDRIAAIQVELSLRPLYDDQLTIRAMMDLLANYGFDVVAFEPGFSDKETGEYLQVDGIFRNRRMKPIAP